MDEKGNTILANELNNNHIGKQIKFTTTEPLQYIIRGILVSIDSYTLELESELTFSNYISDEEAIKTLNFEDLRTTGIIHITLVDVSCKSIIAIDWTLHNYLGIPDKWHLYVDTEVVII